MNRQYRREVKKAEARTRDPRRQVKPQAAAARKDRTRPRQFFREVVAELGKVAWPTRQEVVSYSIVVLVSVTLIGAIIFGMDYVFTKGVLSLFGVQ